MTEMKDKRTKYKWFLPMTNEYRADILSMMRVFYASPAVATNGSEEIFRADVDACVSDNPYLSGFVFMQDDSLAGYCMLAKSFSTEYGVPCIWIEDLYVQEAYRGTGIGSQIKALEKNLLLCSASRSGHDRDSYSEDAGDDPLWRPRRVCDRRVASRKKARPHNARDGRQEAGDVSVHA